MMQGNVKFLKDANFDYIYKTVDLFVNTENDLLMLKRVIQRTEKDTAKDKMTKKNGEDPGNDDLSTKSSKISVISKVCKKYTFKKDSSSRVDGTLILNESKCPPWLLCIRDVYNAVMNAFMEIKEQVKQLCNKYTTQQTIYLKIKDDLKQLPKRNVSEGLNRIRTEFDKEVEIISLRIAMQAHQKAKFTEKLEQVKTTCASIRCEIESIAEKSSKILSSLEEENNFFLNSDEIIQDAFKKIDIQKDFSEKLREQRTEDADILKTAKQRYCEELNYIQDQITELESNLEEAESEYQKLQAIARSKDNSCGFLGPTQQYFNVTRESLLERVNKREPMLDTILRELRRSKMSNEDLLDTKKRTQEHFQSLYSCASAIKRELTEAYCEKFQKLRDISTSIMEEKINSILPLKEQITAARGDLQQVEKASTERRVAYETLTKRANELETESRSLKLERNRVKYAISLSRSKAERLRTRCEQETTLVRRLEELWQQESAAADGERTFGVVRGLLGCGQLADALADAASPLCLFGKFAELNATVHEEGVSRSRERSAAQQRVTERGWELAYLRDQHDTIARQVAERREQVYAVLETTIALGHCWASATVECGARPQSAAAAGSRKRGGRKKTRLTAARPPPSPATTTGRAANRKKPVDPRRLLPKGSPTPANVSRRLTGHRFALLR